MACRQFSRRQFLRTSAAGAGAAATRERPNIVFLMSDQHRADALGCAGNQAIRTPNLDGLAGRGVRFARTYCQGPLCQPSRASLMTGQYLHEHGQTYNGLNMNPAWPTMMKQLRGAGYVTAKIGKAHFSGKRTPPGSPDLRESSEWSRSFGLDYLLEEYDRFVYRMPGLRTPYNEYLRSRKLLETNVRELESFGQPIVARANYEGRITALPQEHTLTSFLADRAVDWLRSYQRDKPFFLWVSFIDPHPPFLDDALWAKRYKGARMPPGRYEPPPLPENAWGRYLRERIRELDTGAMTPEIAAEAARHYYGMMSLIDQKIGDIIRAVQERGLERNTWFFYTSDHGEMLGEHSLMQKQVFYKGSVLVPNIIRPPGGMPGRAVEGPVESIDITATVMDVAGVELPRSRGRSLVPLMKGQGAARDVAYSELAGNQNKGNFFVMAATRRYRYLYDKENKLACELFDLEKDPDEVQNLVDDPRYAGLRRDLHKDFLLPFLEDKTTGC